MRRRKWGFTLIELLAAVSISGLAMLGGVMIVGQVTDATERIMRGGFIATHDGNGPRVLRQMMLDARVTADSLDWFRGDERSMDFTTICRHPRGWLEQCRASIAIDWRKDTSVVTALLSTGENFELCRRAGAAELRYVDAAVDSIWLRRWAPSIAMPLVVALVTVSDTSILSLGMTR